MASTKEIKTKKNVALITILLVLVGVVYFIGNTSKIFPGEKAKEIAGPIIEKCWVSNESNKIEIKSLTAILVDRQLSQESKTEKYWRVGASYSITDKSGTTFQYSGSQNDIPGNIPEVFINAKTGEVTSKHFEEISTPSPGCE